jgi:hypothetical protein
MGSGFFFKFGGKITCARHFFDLALSLPSPCQQPRQKQMIQ